MTVEIVRFGEIRTDSIDYYYVLKEENGKTCELFRYDTCKYQNELSYPAIYDLFEMNPILKSLSTDEIKKCFGPISSVTFSGKDRESIKMTTKKVIDWFKNGLKKSLEIAEERNLEKWFYKEMNIKIKV